MLYGSMIPIAYPVAAIGFFLFYLSEKYMLLRINSFPKKVYFHLHSYMMKFIPAGVLIGWCGCALWHFIKPYNEESYLALLVGICVIALIFLAMPLLDWCIKTCNCCHRRNACKCCRRKKINPEKDDKGSQNEPGTGNVPPKTTSRSDFDAP